LAARSPHVGPAGCQCVVGRAGPARAANKCSGRGRTGVGPGSGRGRTGVGPRSDRGRPSWHLDRGARHSQRRANPDRCQARRRTRGHRASASGGTPALPAAGNGMTRLTQLGQHRLRVVLVVPCRGGRERGILLGPTLLTVSKHVPQHDAAVRTHGLVGDPSRLEEFDQRRTGYPEQVSGLLRRQPARRWGPR